MRYLYLLQRRRNVADTSTLIDHIVTLLLVVSHDHPLHHWRHLKQYKIVLAIWPLPFAPLTPPSSTNGLKVMQWLIHLLQEVMLTMIKGRQMVSILINEYLHCLCILVKYLSFHQVLLISTFF